MFRPNLCTVSSNYHEDTSIEWTKNINIIFEILCNMTTQSSGTKDPEGSQSPTAVMEPAARMKLLVEMSHNISVDRNIPIDKYFHSGRELIKSAAALESKGDIERAFVLYLRFMTLFLEKLVNHPQYSKADKNEKKLVKDECNHVFDLAEGLKKRIMEKYEKEYMDSLSKGEHLVKRSVGPQTSSPKDCDVDEIDKKFDFSQTPSSDPLGQSRAFDPFNIDELKRSFNNTDS